MFLNSFFERLLYYSDSVGLESLGIGRMHSLCGILVMMLEIIKEEVFCCCTVLLSRELRYLFFLFVLRLFLRNTLNTARISSRVCRIIMFGNVITSCIMLQRIYTKVLCKNFSNLFFNDRRRH